MALSVNSSACGVPFYQRVSVTVSGGRMPLVLCGGSVIQRNWIFPRLWLPARTPVAEIGRLCQPLPGRSDFCPDDRCIPERLCLNLIPGYCPTSSAFPSWWVEEVKDPSHRLRSANAWPGSGPAGGAGVQGPAKPSSPGAAVGLSALSGGILEFWMRFSSLAFPSFLFSLVSVII